MSADVPEHLRHWPGLFEWRDGRVADAPPEDIAVARAYPQYDDKGPIVDGARLTIMIARNTCTSLETVRIIHVVEVLEPGRDVAVAGPKPVYGEYLDGRPVTPPPPHAGLVPDLYNGEMIASPAVDYAYEVTSYRVEPGDHEFQWRLEPYESNKLAIHVISAKAPSP